MAEWSGINEELKYRLEAESPAKHIGSEEEFFFFFFGSNLLCSRDSPYVTHQVLGVSMESITWTGTNQTQPNYESHTSPISLPL